MHLPGRFGNGTRALDTLQKFSLAGSDRDLFAGSNSQTGQDLLLLVELRTQAANNRSERGVNIKQTLLPRLYACY